MIGKARQTNRHLVKRVLVQAYWKSEKILTVLPELGSIINFRLLIYMSKKESLKPISPAMFLKNIHEYGLPEVDAVEKNSLEDLKIGNIEDLS